LTSQTATLVAAAVAAVAAAAAAVAASAFGVGAKIALKLPPLPCERLSDQAIERLSDFVGMVATLKDDSGRDF
jgi:hypothetical protein